MLDHEKGGYVLNAFPTSKPMGFTLIEMMIVVAIIAIATALGLPSYRTWVQNTQVRNAAESVANGLQKAKAEAVKQNANIEFVLGTNPLTHLFTNPPWKIQVPASAVLESSSIEGSKNVKGTATPTAATTITFNSLGGVGVPPNQPRNTDGTMPFTQIDFNSSILSAADNRQLRVTIGIGGNVRMCDPDPSSKLAATDPRKC
jgi:type IV fimbrial biogenesis protein FimT